MELSNLVVTEPISIPYNQLQHGNSLKEFQQPPAESGLFRNKYPTSVDQLLFLACNLELSKTTLQSLDENLNNFKEHL